MNQQHVSRRAMLDTDLQSRNMYMPAAQAHAFDRAHVDTLATLQFLPVYPAFRAHPDKRNDSRVRFRKSYTDRVYLWLLPAGVAVSRRLDSEPRPAAVPYSDVVAVSVSSMGASANSRPSLSGALSMLTGGGKKGFGRRASVQGEAEVTEGDAQREEASEGRSRHSLITPASGKILGVEFSNGTKEYYAMEPCDADAIVAHIVEFRRLQASQSLVGKRATPLSSPLAV